MSWCCHDSQRHGGLKICGRNPRWLMAILWSNKRMNIRNKTNTIYYSIKVTIGHLPFSVFSVRNERNDRPPVDGMGHDNVATAAPHLNSQVLDWR